MTATKTKTKKKPLASQTKSTKKTTEKPASKSKEKSARKKVDEFLLKMGPSVQSSIQKLSKTVENGVATKVEDVKNLGLQILKRAQNLSETLKKTRSKK